MTRKLYTFNGGVHPEGHKAASNATPIRDLPLSPRYIVPLRQHIGELSVSLNPEAAKSLGVQSGDLLQVNGAEAKVILDETVPASVVLVPRSMGLAVGTPVVAELKKA